MKSMKSSFYKAYSIIYLFYFMQAACECLVKLKIKLEQVRTVIEMHCINILVVMPKKMNESSELGVLLRKNIL